MVIPQKEYWSIASFPKIVDEAGIIFTSGGVTAKTIKSRCEQTFWEKLEIVPARLGNDAGIIGAAALALESAFATPRSATSERKQDKPR